MISRQLIVQSYVAENMRTSHFSLGELKQDAYGACQ